MAANAIWPPLFIVRCVLPPLRTMNSPKGLETRYPLPCQEVSCMALDYDQMRDWCRTHDLIINRCKIINAVVEDRATIEHPRGCDYRLVMMGCVVASWRWPDLDSVRDALSRADAAFEVLWTVRREGYASFG